MPPKQEAKTVPPEEVDMPTLRVAFVELVAERYGYSIGVKAHRLEMAKDTKDQRKTVNDLRKTVNTAIEELIVEPTDDLRTQILNGRKELKKAKEILKKAEAPFRTKIKPLAKAVRWMDNVAIPDSLKELGVPLQPRFSLTDMVQEAIKQKPKK